MILLPWRPLLSGGRATSLRCRSARREAKGAPPLPEVMLEGSAATVTPSPRGSRPGTDEVVERDEKEREAGEDA
jgi:hypothetical protein